MGLPAERNTQAQSGGPVSGLLTDQRRSPSIRKDVHTDHLSLANVTLGFLKLTFDRTWPLQPVHHSSGEGVISAICLSSHELRFYSDNRLKRSYGEKRP